MVPSWFSLGVALSVLLASHVTAQDPPMRIERVVPVRTVTLPGVAPTTQPAVRAPAPAPAPAALVTVQRVPVVRTVSIPLDAPVSVVAAPAASKPIVRAVVAQPPQRRATSVPAAPVSRTPAAAPTTARKSSYPIDILAAIDTAVKILSDARHRVASGTRLFQIVNTQTGATRLVNATFDGRSLTPGVTMALVKDNGVNSIYHVDGGWVVVGQKSSNGFLYVPYSPELDVWEVRERGKKHLETIAAKASAHITSHHVRLRFGLSEGFRQRMAMVLALVENVDPGEFLTGKPIEKLTGRVFTIVGANLSHAYGHMHSPAGARGLMQIMHATYKGVRAAYPEAALPVDTEVGRRHQQTAMVTAMLLCDMNRALLGNAAALLPEQNDQEIARWLAVAYNTGGGRARGTLRRAGAQWAQKLRYEEARVYARKLTAIWEHLYRKTRVAKKAPGE